MLEHVTQRLGVLDGDPESGSATDPIDDVGTEEVGRGYLSPKTIEGLDARRRRIRSEHRSIERPDGRPHDQIGKNPGVDQRSQHAHLDRAPPATTTEHECNMRRPCRSILLGHGRG